MPRSRHLECREESVELLLLLPRGRWLSAAPTSRCPRRYGNCQAVSKNARYIILLIVIRENLHTVDIFSTTYLPRLVNVVCECPLTFTGVKFGTKEPKTPVLPYTLEHVLFLFKNSIINLLQTFRKIRSDF